MEAKKPHCPEIQISPVAEECRPAPSGLDNSLMYRFLGNRKNLRGLKPKVGDVWQLPKGFVCYTRFGWAEMIVPKKSRTSISSAKQQNHTSV